MSDSPKAIQFGVLYCPNYQLLDAAGPIDLINNHNRYLLEAFKFPKELVDKAPVITWHSISSTGTLEPMNATTGPVQTPSTTFETCPQLDYLLVPGPEPNIILSDECIAFVQKQFPGLKALLTVCSGSMVLAQTGVLDGVRCATNKFALRGLVMAGAFDKFKRVNWVTDRRFVVDGKVWSAAGVTSGIDLGAEFCKVHFDPELVKIVLEVAELEPKPAHPDAFAYILEGVELK